MAESEQRAILNDGSAKYSNKDEGLVGPGPGPHGIETIPDIKTVHTVKTESVPIIQKRDIKNENENGSDSSHDEKQTGDLRKRVEHLQINDANPPPIDVCRKRSMDRDIEEVPDSRTVKIKTEDVVFEDKEIIFIPKQKASRMNARDYRRDLQLRYGRFNIGSSISSSTAGQSSRRQKPHPERERQKDSSESVSGPSQ